jgi:hypothetical protein
MCRHTVLTLFARYFVVLKSNTCVMHVMHVGGNSKTVINAARSNGFGKQSQTRFEKKIQTYCDINKKIVAVFILHIYIYSSIRHILQYSLSMKIYFGNSRSSNFSIQENFSITHIYISHYYFVFQRVSKVVSYQVISYSTTFKLIFVL